MSWREVLTARRVRMVAIGLLSSLVLAACGWHLQGAHPVPTYVTPLYLELTDIHSSFAQALTQRLREAGVSVTDDVTGAKAVLHVTTDRKGHRVSSVSALNEPQQFEVFYELEYALDARPPLSGRLLENQSLNAVRTMSYDKRLALAKQREELFMTETLADDLADQVMRRLQWLPATPQTATQ